MGCKVSFASKAHIKVGSVSPLQCWDVSKVVGLLSVS